MLDGKKKIVYIKALQVCIRRVRVCVAVHFHGAEMRGSAPQGMDSDTDNEMENM